ncbi:MAG: hypothetical protein JO275_13730 [Verrucomicrobia bacterium]|nr:hypothetical protein [Verrucomicrobiota bacterium]
MRPEFFKAQLLKSTPASAVSFVVNAGYRQVCAVSRVEGKLMALGLEKAPMRKACCLRRHAGNG